LKIYVCYGTWKAAPRPGGHPCGQAYHALVDAGYDPKVVRAYGLGALPDFLNQTPGRREVKRLTGNNWVPLLVTDDGEPIQGSRTIIAWAKDHPAGSAAPARDVADGAVAGAAGTVAGGPNTPS
jgi:hypothetical protein